MPSTAITLTRDPPLIILYDAMTLPAPTSGEEVRLLSNKLEPLILERLALGPCPSATFGRGVSGFGGSRHIEIDGEAEEVRYLGIIAGGRVMVTYAARGFLPDEC